MRANREAIEVTGIGVASSVAPESARRGPWKEEWTWMVDEDPAFYLNESGTAVSGNGE